MANNRYLSSTNTIYSNFFDGLCKTSLLYLTGNIFSNLLANFSFNEELYNSPIYARVLFLLGFTAVSSSFAYCAYLRNNMMEENHSQLSEELAKLKVELDSLKLRTDFCAEPDTPREDNQRSISTTDRQSLLHASPIYSS